MTDQAIPFNVMRHTDKMSVVDHLVDRHDRVIIFGSRNSGKTTGAILTLIRILKQQAHRAKLFVGRESHAGCLQLGNELFLLCCTAFGAANVTRNQNMGLISVTFPEGTGSVLIKPFSDLAGYAAIQGANFTGAFFDEAGGYSKSGWDLMDQIMTNIRGPKGMHLPVMIALNPFGQSHGRAAKAYINKAPAWTPYTDPETGMTCINCQVNLDDNPHADIEAYERTLKQACKGNPEKYRAWRYGEFNLNIASFWGGVWDPNVHLLPEELTVQELLQYNPIVRGGGDWGTRSACCYHLGLKLRSDLIIGERRYRAGSIFIMAETHTLADDSLQGDLSLGTGIPAAAWATQIKDLCLNDCSLRVMPKTAHDAATGLNGDGDTVHNILGQNGVPCWSPFKGRAAGFALITEKLDAAKHDTGPGLYIHPRCRYLLATLPDCPGSKDNPDVIDPKFKDDHAIDAAAYLTSFFNVRSGHGRHNYYGF